MTDTVNFLCIYVCVCSLISLCLFSCYYFFLGMAACVSIFFYVYLAYYADESCYGKKQLLFFCSLYNLRFTFAVAK